MDFFWGTGFIDRDRTFRDIGSGMNAVSNAGNALQKLAEIVA